MIFIFWGVMVLLTAAAAVPLLIFRQDHSVLSLLAKIIILLLVPVLGLLLYWNLGDAGSLFQYWALGQRAQVVKRELAKIKSSQAVVEQLKTYLIEHPDSPQGWYLLGKLYYAQRDFKRALPALRRAYDQAPQHLMYAVSLAETDFFYHQRRLSPEMKKLMLHVVQKDQHNVGALNLLAINNYLQGRYRFAIQYWERLLPLFPVGSKDEKFLLSMIAKAQKEEK